MILVTGASGFVGGHVVHALRGRDLPVRALVRNPSKAGKLVAWGAELAQGDMTDPDSLRRAVDSAETVVHLDELRQVLLLLADVDIGVAVVVENPEEPVDLDVYARRLEERVVVGIDLDAALREQPGDRPVGEDHEAILRPATLC